MEYRREVFCAKFFSNEFKGILNKYNVSVKDINPLDTIIIAAIIKSAWLKNRTRFTAKKEIEELIVTYAK